VRLQSKQGQDQERMNAPSKDYALVSSATRNSPSGETEVRRLKLLMFSVLFVLSFWLMIL
jgi:hypothetical protein